MNTFKKKSLYAALAGVGALGATGAAQAVNVNPDGLGQVLIYPYYTVACGPRPATPYNSLLSVVNSTASAKAVKVRFLEGKNSREVLDFNLYLSAKDVWTAAHHPDRAPAAPACSPTDKSCTLPAESRRLADAVRELRLRRATTRATTLDRTREGYVEIIEMATYDDASTTAKNVTHVSGVPPLRRPDRRARLRPTRCRPTGGLFGGMTLINVLEGTALHGRRRRARQLLDVTAVHRAPALTRRTWTQRVAADQRASCRERHRLQVDMDCVVPRIRSARC